MDKGTQFAAGMIKELNSILGINTELSTAYCYESPKKEMVSHAFKHFIQNLKSYNRVKV